MISLHKIIELVNCEKLGVSDAVSQKDALLLDSIVKDKAKKAICFHMGNIGNLVGLKGKDFLLRLPYPVCWFEFDYICTHQDEKRKGMIEHIGVICWENKKHDSIQCIGLTKQVKKEWLIFAGCVFTKMSGGVVEVRALKNTENSNNRLIYACSFIDAFLSALRCINVDKTENLPPEKLQKKRKKTGKQPLFSYWTLRLKVPNESKNKTENMGGSHASPRLHLRRGHPREYKPGKYTWVQPCVVGNKNNGMIHKDYGIKED